MVQRRSVRFPGIPPAVSHGGGMAVVAGGAVRGGPGAALPFLRAGVIGFKPLLDHHAERWLVWFGILVVAIAVVAAVTGIATMLRVNRALADASVSERGDAAAHNAPARAEAARLIAAGYAGMITGHTHEPEISQVGARFLRQHRMCDRGGTGAEGQIRAADAVPGRAAAVDGRAAGRARCYRSHCRSRAPHRSALLPRATGPRPRAGPAPRRSRSSAICPTEPPGRSTSGPCCRGYGVAGSGGWPRSRCSSRGS